MEKFSDIFNKFTSSVVSLIDIVLSVAVCYRVYVLSGSWILTLLAYPALLVVQALFIGYVFVKELTFDEDKLKDAVEEAQPWIMLLDTAVFMLTFI